MSDVDERKDDMSDGGGGDDLFGDDDGDDASQIEDNPPIPSDDDSAPDQGHRRSATPDSPPQRAVRSQRDLTPEIVEENQLVHSETLFRHGLPKTDGSVSAVLVKPWSCVCV